MSGLVVAARPRTFFLLPVRGAAARPTCLLSPCSLRSLGRRGVMVIDMDGARARLRRISDLLEAKECYSVGGSRRFLAAQRRRTWSAAAERLRLAVERLGLSHPDNPPFGLVTVSVGAAALGPSDLAETADAWFARVDAALYEAKDAGRNRVAVAHALSPSSVTVNAPTSVDGSAA